MAGMRYKRAVFSRPGEGVEDEGGAPVGGEMVVIGEAFADLREMSDKEKVEAGRAVSERVAKAYVRSNPATRAVAAGHIMDIAGEVWAVSSNIPDPKNERFSRELTVTRIGRDD